MISSFNPGGHLAPVDGSRSSPLFTAASSMLPVMRLLVTSAIRFTTTASQHHSHLIAPSVDQHREQEVANRPGRRSGARARML